jgi:sugar transferase (PEP-CTERM/EpsH1 system associated)
MKVLFISWWFPYPANNGSKIRIFNLLRELAKHHEITLLSFAEPGEASKADRDVLLDMCRQVHVAPRIHFSPKHVRALVGFLSPRPRSLVDAYSPVMARLIRDKIAEDGYNLILASELDSIPYALQVNGVPRVLEDLELAVRREKYASQTNLTRQLRYGLSWWKTARYVRQALHQFDACTVVSEEERQLLAKIVPQSPPVAVIPNGVDLAFNSGDFGPPEPGALVYNGALTYDANFDAVSFFLAEVWPRIRARRPDARFYITGHTGGVPLADLPPAERVVFTGYLDDVRPRVAQSQAAVIPLRIGAGTRLKILEAMALETPVVSTSKGVEGLEVTHEENVLVADDPGDFARAVVHLLEDEDLSAKLSANGRQLVEKRYSWEMCVRQLKQLLDQVVGQGAQSND